MQLDIVQDSVLGSIEIVAFATTMTKYQGYETEKMQQVLNNTI